MIYIITAILGIVLYRQKNSIARILFIMLLFTVLGAFSVGYDIFQFEAVPLLITLYTSICLFVLFSSLKRFSRFKVIDIRSVNLPSLRLLEKVLGVAALLAFVIDIYVLIKIFPLLIAEQINVQEYKNEGGAVEMLDTLVPHIFITISNVFSAVGFFFLSIHFYYFVNGRLKKAMICLLLSLIIILSRLIGLSRSGLIEYFLTYFVLFFYFWPMLRKVLKKKIKPGHLVVFAIVIGAFIWVFSAISSSRFSDYYTKTSDKTALIDETSNPVLFSSLDYMSQWIYHNNNVIKRHEMSNIMFGGYAFDELGRWVRNRIAPNEDAARRAERKKNAALGDSSTAFIGVVSALTIDFGLFGAFLFVVLISFVFMSLSPKRGVISFKSLLWLPLIVNFASMFWNANMFIVMSFDLAVFYTIIWSALLIKRKKRKKKVKNVQSTNMAEVVITQNA